MPLCRNRVDHGRSNLQFSPCSFAGSLPLAPTRLAKRRMLRIGQTFRVGREQRQCPEKEVAPLNRIVLVAPTTTPTLSRSTRHPSYYVRKVDAGSGVGTVPGVTVTFPLRKLASIGLRFESNKEFFGAVDCRYGHGPFLPLVNCLDTSRLVASTEITSEAGECDYSLGNTRVVCNPYGYPHERNGRPYPQVVLEIPGRKPTGVIA
jgi:hypothetical protein